MSDEPLYNIDVLRTQVNHDESFVQHMVKNYVEKTPAQLDELEKAALDEDWQLLSSLCHKIKSPARMLGMKIIADRLMDIEVKAKKHAELEHLQNDVQQVTVLIRTVLSDLKDF